jgi:hypothetical protein
MNEETQQRLAAAVDLLGRTGADSMQIRYSDDEQPVVWFAVALYRDGKWETASAANPLRAILRLGEQLLDGGQCRHCNRPTGLEPDSIDVPAGMRGLVSEPCVICGQPVETDLPDAIATLVETWAHRRCASWLGWIATESYEAVRPTPGRRLEVGE